jgi:hypothetical protein
MYIINSYVNWFCELARSGNAEAECGAGSTTCALPYTEDLHGDGALVFRKIRWARRYVVQSCAML